MVESVKMSFFFCLVSVFRKRENLINIFEKMSWISRSHFSSLVIFHVFMYLCMYYLIEAAYNLDLWILKPIIYLVVRFLDFWLLLFFWVKDLYEIWTSLLTHNKCFFLPGCLVVNWVGKIFTSKHQLYCILRWGHSLAALAHLY